MSETELKRDAERSVRLRETVMTALDYKIRGFAEGNYICNCRTCKEQFVGDKRAWRCRRCAAEAKAQDDKIDLRAEMDKLLRGEPLSEGVQAFVCHASKGEGGE